MFERAKSETAVLAGDLIITNGCQAARRGPAAAFRRARPAFIKVDPTAKRTEAFEHGCDAWPIPRRRDVLGHRRDRNGGRPSVEVLIGDPGAGNLTMIFG